MFVTPGKQPDVTILGHKISRTVFSLDNPGDSEMYFTEAEFRNGVDSETIGKEARYLTSIVDFFKQRDRNILNEDSKAIINAGLHPLLKGLDSHLKTHLRNAVRKVNEGELIHGIIDWALPATHIYLALSLLSENNSVFRSEALDPVRTELLLTALLSDLETRTKERFFLFQWLENGEAKSIIADCLARFPQSLEMIKMLNDITKKWAKENYFG